MDLKGKVCLVTGGSSGIGASTAICLAQKGARIASVSRTGGSGKLGKLCSDQTNGAGPRFLKADMADPAACRSCVEQVITEMGRLDVLVHSGGGPVPGGLFAVTDENWMN